MNPTSVLTARPKNSARKLTKSSKLFKTIIKAIRDKKGGNIISLDLKKIPEAVADFFIICEANNSTQIKAIADNVEILVRSETGEQPYRHEGHSALTWVLIDYVNVVVHVMHPEQRKFYRLEEMWSDGKMEEHKD